MKRISRNKMRYIAVILLLGVLFPVFSGVPGLLGGSELQTLSKGGRTAFSNVTGKMDLSALTLQNLRNTLLSGQKTQKNTERTVIVSLAGKTLSAYAGADRVSDFVDTAAGKQAKEKIRAEQEAFLAALSAAGIPYTLRHSYMAVDNAVAIRVNTSYVKQLRQMKNVSGVVVAGAFAYPQTVKSGDGQAVNNAPCVYSTGVYDSSEALAAGLDGSGTIVAILDTGLDYTHPAFLDLPEGKNPVRFTEEDIREILETKDLTANQRVGGTLGVSDVYISAKVPFAFDYADNDADVYPSYSTHGTHVAGIIAGHDENGYTDKDGNHVDEEFYGVAPEAQLMICKVFTDDLEDTELGGAETEDLMAALEDCVLLGVDVINMSLGTSCGFTTSDDGDDEGEYLHRVYTSIGAQGISLVCAASNDFSAGYGSVFGTNLASNPDAGTVGSPATYGAALAVASISGKKSPYLMANGTTPIFFEESSDKDSNFFDFVDMMLEDGEEEADFRYVVVPGVGRASDYSSAVKKMLKDDPNLIVVVQRGDTTFKEKVEVAKTLGAKAIIVSNHVSGSIRMSLGDVKDPIPSASVDINAGAALLEGATDRVGTLRISRKTEAGPFMSDFSSWGSTPDLKLKPEITAHGGEITSTVPGGYDEQSGTSMAAPNMAGVVALIREYVKNENPDMTPQEVNRRINQLLMSTATTVYDRDALPYSPRKQGAGLGSLKNSYSTGAFLWVDNAENDYRPKIELGDDKEKKGNYTLTFHLTNFSAQPLSFRTQSIFMTETLGVDQLSVAEQAYLLDDVAAKWTVGGKASAEGEVFTVEAGEDLELQVTLTLSDAEKRYLDDSFVNGMFVEGFLKLQSESSGQCDLSLPFMGFYGDWSAAPMLDYDAYELDAFRQDSSILEDEKPQACVWGTQPYTVYSNGDYVLPMGSYVYLQPEDADPVYLTMEHNAISCFNRFYGDDDENNYLTAYKMKGLYAGLLRNARSVRYTLRDTVTGEILQQEKVNRIGKAYADGGSARPGFVDIPLDPLEAGLVSGGSYAMDFEFFLDYGDGSANKNTFSFSFTADYEAPMLEDVRVRYYDYKDGKTAKQKIFLDMDVFDNHYPQAVTLCYQDGKELVLATDYVTPIYNPQKNAINTVSIEITDIYEKYKDSLYVQFDDYALNHSIYWLNLSDVNTALTPADFSLATGEESITLGVYDTHTVALEGIGDANLSNFRWTSNNRSVADVRNGEIVGLSEGSAVVTVTNDLRVSKRIQVTVSGGEKTLTVPSVSFGAIKAADGVLKKAEGVVKVYPGQAFSLSVGCSPWYYPLEELQLDWESTDPKTVAVDQDGNVEVLAEGSAVVKATILQNGVPTAYTATVTLQAADPFVVENRSLIKYNGPGGVVEIPTDKNIAMIGEGAFKEHATITEVIIPKSVTSIGTRAFEGCTALRKVYFDKTTEQPIADADISVIYARAFADCTALELLDLSNVKVVTLGRECFSGCTGLREIRKMTKIGSAYEKAFADCISLTEIDLTGTHVSGYRAFAGCTGLREIKTGAFTAIGEEMFAGCTGLRSLKLQVGQIEDRAFLGCTGLHSLTLALPDGEAHCKYFIGSRAFADCTALRQLEIEEGCTVVSIGSYAFGATALTEFTLPDGIEQLGGDILSGSKVRKILLGDGVDLTKVQLSGDPFGSAAVALLPGTTGYVLEDGVLYTADRSVILKVSADVSALTIPEGVSEIRDYAFASGDLSSVSLPGSLKKLGKGAFANSKLREIDLSATQLTELPEAVFAGTRLGAVEIPASVKAIGDRAFASTDLETVVFAGSALTRLGDQVFAGCARLREITLPEQISTVGSECFKDCTALKSAVLPAVKQLGEASFVGCGQLETVRFGEQASALGVRSFYGATALTTVSFGDAVEAIPEECFFGCTALEALDLHKVTEIGDRAFAECTALRQLTGLDKVVRFGEMACYNAVSLPALRLQAAEIIGDGAFAMEKTEKTYTELSIPAAKEIGVMAFMGGAEAAVELPKTLTKLGYGAFCASKNLAAITVEEGNDGYFAPDGVLYRRLPNGGSELCAYPGGRKAEDGCYTLQDGCVSVADYACNRLADGALQKVILPYSLKQIGVSAFFESGISEYEFRSISAPTLCTVYREDVIRLMEEHLSGTDLLVNGMFYANFNTLRALYTDFVGEKSDMVMHIPANGVGYDNPVFGGYFGKAYSLGVLIDDTTRAAMEAIAELEDPETASEWLELEQNDSNKQDIIAFANRVKDARRLYNNIISEEQLAFVPAALREKLTAVETVARALKEKFGIPLVVSEVRPGEGYKKEYEEGERFRTDGLTLTVVYDDGSVGEADPDKLMLISPTDGVLTQYDQFVVYAYRYGEDDSLVKEVHIPVTVTPGAGVSGEQSKRWWIPVTVVCGALLCLAGAVFGLGKCGKLPEGLAKRLGMAAPAEGVAAGVPAAPARRKPVTLSQLKKAKRHSVGNLIKWTSVGLGSVALVALILFAASNGRGSGSGEVKIPTLTAQIVYKGNGGLFENNMEEKTIGYSDGSYPLNIGNVTVSNGSVGISRRGYRFTGWYTAATDAEGNLIYEDREAGIVQTGEPYDFDRILESGSSCTLYAGWIKEKTMPVLLAGCAITDKAGSEYPIGSLLRELTVGADGKFDKYTGSKLVSLKNGSYTFLQYYTDAECTVPVQWPVQSGEADEMPPIYAKFIEGDWKVVSDVQSAKKMLSSLIGGNYYLVNDIDMGGESVSISNNPTMGARIEGNGYTVSNFKVTKRGVEKKGSSLFGSMKEGAAMHDLTLEGIDFELLLKGDTSAVYFLFGEMPADADLVNVKVSGSMKVSCPEGSVVENLQPGSHTHWIVGAGDSDDAALADGTLSVEVVCTVGEQTYTYPEKP